MLSEIVQLPAKALPTTPDEAEKNLAEMTSPLEKARAEANYTETRRLHWAMAGVRNSRRSTVHEEIMETRIQVIRVGDTVFSAVPGEMLVKLGLEIKARVRMQNIFVITMANDCIGYLPNREDYALGGYEPATSCFILPGGGETIVEAVLALIERL